MPRSQLSIGFAQGRSKPLNASRLINLYPEQAPAGSLAPWVLQGAPGLKSWTTAGGGKIKAGRDALGYAYIFSGTQLYRVDSNGSATLCSGAIAASDTATMVDNGTQLALLSNRDLYTVTGTTITRVTSAGFPTSGMSSIDYVGGYGAFSIAGTSQWGITALSDFSTIDALDFVTCESASDGLQCVKANHQEVWAFGTKTIEPWANTGAAAFPFERIGGAIMDKGTIARFSPTRLDNAMFWLGDDRIVYRADGYQPIRVSDFAVEEVLRSGDCSDAIGMAYAMGGHTFYVLKLPGLRRTFVCDAATGHKWHERRSGSQPDEEAWLPNCLFTAFGKTLAGGELGAVYELDLDTFADAGNPIRSAVISTPLYGNGRRGILHMVELEAELGVGLPNGAGSDPKAMLRISRDGGITWGNERTASLGPGGERRKRARWFRNGAYQNAVIEIAIADPVKRSIYGANYEVEELGH